MRQGRRKEKERREEGEEEKGERGGVRGKIMGFPPSSQDYSPFGLRERAPSLSVLITSLSATSIASTTVASLPGGEARQMENTDKRGFSALQHQDPLSLFSPAAPGLIPETAWSVSQHRSGFHSVSVPGPWNTAGRKMGNATSLAIF